MYRSQVWYQNSWLGGILCSILAGRARPRDSITIVCFHTTTCWHGAWLPEGTGGSEQAVIHLSEALVKAGWFVTVYNNCGAQSLTHNNVLYVPSWKFNHRTAHDIVVLWRMNRLAAGYRINCRTLIQWHHDTLYPSEVDGAKTLRTDKHIVGSQFHRNQILHIDDSRIEIVSNAVRCPESLAGTLGPGSGHAYRRGGKCIYTSAPDRGLECLLYLWPMIRTRCPWAELSVFYGWKIWKQAQDRHPFDVAWFKRIEGLLDAEGIVRKNVFLDEATLWHEYYESDVWLYPTQHNESSCITAMKAQVAGAVPVTTTCGALRETVQWGVKIHSESIYTDEIAQQKFVDAAVRILTKGYFERRRMMRWAETHFSWDRVAQRWIECFESLDGRH